MRWVNELEGLLVSAAASAPGGLLERFGGSTLGLSPVARRALEIKEDVPGIILEGVHAVHHE